MLVCTITNQMAVHADCSIKGKLNNKVNLYYQVVDGTILFANADRERYVCQYIKKTTRIISIDKLRIYACNVQKMYCVIFARVTRRLNLRLLVALICEVFRIMSRGIN